MFSYCHDRRGNLFAICTILGPNRQIENALNVDNRENLIQGIGCASDGIAKKPTGDNEETPR